MRYTAVLLLPLLFICSCASTPAVAETSGEQAPEPEKQRLAVLDMEDTTGDIDDESLRQATDYLRILVVQSRRFIVVSDEEKRALIRELRKESYGAQYDESQHVPLGERVAANVALITTILKPQEDYILKAELIDLAKETIVAGASEKFAPDTFQQAIERVAQAVTESPEGPERPATDTALAGGMVPVTGSGADGARNDTGDAGGVNFLIINIISAREGREPDPAYRSATRKRNTPNTDTAAPTNDPSAQGSDTSSSTVSPLPSKQVFFRSPVKPIRFRIPEATHQRISAPPSKESPSPAASRIPITSPEPSSVPHVVPRVSAPRPVHLDSTGDELPPVERNGPNDLPPAVKREEPVHTRDRVEPAPVPRPVFTPSKGDTEKKKEEDEDKENDGKKEEKKKRPSPGTIFVPRQ